MKQTVGILLAGGKSRRYGSEKASAKIDGEQFYEKMYNVLQEVCDDVVIVTREELCDKFPSHYQVVTDVEAFVGCGPLAGIYSAMTYIEAKRYVVLPCDMPLINSNIMSALLNLHEAEITVVEVNNRLQPLVSIWDQSTREKIANALQERQYRMRDVFNTSSIMKVAGESLADDVEVFMNVNTPKQDREMREWLKS